MLEVSSVKWKMVSCRCKGLLFGQWRVRIAHPILQSPWGKKQNIIEADPKFMQIKTVRDYDLEHRS